MALSEFQLIERYFAHLGRPRQDVLLGVGDDCALLSAPSGQLLAATLDTLVEGVHFSPGADPESLGYKSLAVNLSDLAAMGAEPAWASLSLTLPEVDDDWLSAFSKGFGALADAYGVALIGGDTCRGPLSISVQLQGLIPDGKEIRRDGAHPGDLIYVTGTLGDAGLALLAEQGRHDAGIHTGWLRDRLQRPQPRVGAGMSLRGVASAAIDVSDGLLADLGHICRKSGVGASIALAQLPLSEAVAGYVEAKNDPALPLTAGDDYELCLTLPQSARRQLDAIASDLDCALTRIGRIEAEPGIRTLTPEGAPMSISTTGYEHFRGS